MSTQPGPAPYPLLPPGSISLSEWRELKCRYAAWGKTRKHRPLEKYYNPNWPPYTAEREIPGRITDIMNRYHEYVKDRRILLFNQSDPTNHIAKRYVVRGTDDYSARTKKRLSDIRSDWDRRPGKDKAMLITIAPRALGSVYALHKQMKSLWPKFTDWIRHRFLFDRSLWAAEPTQRNYTHYHLVISGLHPKGLMAQEILGWFKSHGVDIEGPGVEVEVCREDPVSYALKYVSKGTDNLFWQGIMWMSNGRMWGASRGLGRGGVVTKSEGKWTYCGVCNKDWFAKYRESLVWGDVLPERLLYDHIRDKYMSPMPLPL